MKNKLNLMRCFVIAAVVLPLMAGLYISSVVWRVSVAEQKIFGHSELIPLSFPLKPFRNPGTESSYGSLTYTVFQDGKEITIYKQLINGFQHTYGSALIARELGPRASDLIFRTNEYVEAMRCKQGNVENHYWDTRKDLQNNLIGRRIGRSIRTLPLTFKQGERLMAERTLDALNNGVAISHFLDPRVEKLPTLEQFGCPHFPKPRELTRLSYRDIYYSAVSGGKYKPTTGPCEQDKQAAKI